MTFAPIVLWRVGMFSCTITHWEAGPPFVVCVFRDTRLVAQDRFVSLEAAARHALSSLRKTQPQ
ncbi:MAG TPA: hypothetical protein VGI56_14200 [Galbitalea sp.]|jgi:hypothetical protein